MYQGIESQNFRLGQIAGIQIQVHWMLPVFWLFQLNDYLPLQTTLGLERRILLLWWAQGIVILFGSILLHELGHAFAARRVGGDCDRVVLWPLGGLAFCRTPNFWHAKLIVSAGGPAVNLVLAAIAYMGTALVPDGTGVPFGPTWVFHQILPELLRCNLVLLIFNLFPLYPLDGGSIFLNGVWGLLESRRVYIPYQRAVVATVWAARVSGVGGILYGLQTGSTLIVLVLAWCWYTTEQLLREERGF